MIPETLLPKFVHLKFLLAGLLTYPPIVAFPLRNKNSGVSNNQ